MSNEYSGLLALAFGLMFVALIIIACNKNN